MFKVPQAGDLCGWSIAGRGDRDTEEVEEVGKGKCLNSRKKMWTFL